MSDPYGRRHQGSSRWGHASGHASSWAPPSPAGYGSGGNKVHPSQHEDYHLDKRLRREPLALDPYPHRGQPSRHSGSKYGKHRHGLQRHAQPDLLRLPTAENYLDSYPGVKDLLQQFKNRGTDQSPLAVVNEYAARMMQQVIFDMQQESLSGGFRVEARLMSKRSPEPLEVAAAALLERLLESSPELAPSLVEPNAGDKAPKKWQAPQKPGLGVDPASLNRPGGGPPFRRFGPPRFVKGGTLIPGEAGFDHIPGKGAPPPSVRSHGTAGSSRHHHHPSSRSGGGGASSSRGLGSRSAEPLYRQYERQYESSSRHLRGGDDLDLPAGEAPRQGALGSSRHGSSWTDGLGRGGALGGRGEEQGGGRGTAEGCDLV